MNDRAGGWVRKKGGDMEGSKVRFHSVGGVLAMASRRLGWKMTAKGLDVRYCLWGSGYSFVECTSSADSSDPTKYVSNNIALGLHTKCLLQRSPEFVVLMEEEWQRLMVRFGILLVAG